MPDRHEGPATDDRIRMQHMLDAAREAMGFAQDKPKSYFEHDRMLQLALVQCVQMIGEAAAHVTEDGRSKAGAIPWQQIVGMRHILVHVYFDVDLDAVWAVVQDDLPVLAADLQRVIAAWDPTKP